MSQVYGLLLERNRITTCLIQFVRTQVHCSGKMELTRNSGRFKCCFVCGGLGFGWFRLLLGHCIWYGNKLKRQMEMGLIAANGYLNYYLPATVKKIEYI